MLDTLLVHGIYALFVNLLDVFLLRNSRAISIALSSALVMAGSL